MITFSKRNHGKMNKTSYVSFPIRSDKEVFSAPVMIPNVPLIEMEYDNDCESEWPEIDQCIENMTMSLSMAVYDQEYN